MRSLNQGLKICTLYTIVHMLSKFLFWKWGFWAKLAVRCIKEEVF